MAEWMEELRKLDELRADSLITEEEYEEQKALIIPSGHTPSLSTQREYMLVGKYKLGGLGKAISILAVIFSIFSLWRLTAFVNRANLLNDVQDGYGISFIDAENADSMVRASLGVSVIANFALLFCMIAWAWRATSNLDRLGISHRWGKGWAIGSWFTPIMFFFVPYQIVSDAWKKAPEQNVSNTSSNLELVDQRNNFWLIGFILWWVQIAVNQISGNQNGETIDGLMTADVLGAVGSGFGIIAGISIAIAFSQMSKRHS